MRSHRESHLVSRIGWLRAAVLGANDGIVSTASLIMGVAASGAPRSAVLVSGIAGLVAGAMSMAAGEYVSVRALSMSVLLAENTPHNGPLMVLPGSHRTYLTCIGETPDDHYLSSLKRQEYGVPDEDSLAELAHRHGIVAPTGKPGTVILFDCNLMHGSNGNITPFPRANAFLVYNAVSNRLEEPFGAPRRQAWNALPGCLTIGKPSSAGMDSETAGPMSAPKRRLVRRPSLGWTMGRRLA